MPSTKAWSPRYWSRMSSPNYSLLRMRRERNSLMLKTSSEILRTQITSSILDAASVLNRSYTRTIGSCALRRIPSQCCYSGTTCLNKSKIWLPKSFQQLDICWSKQNPKRWLPQPKPFFWSAPPQPAKKARESDIDDNLSITVSNPSCLSLPNVCTAKITSWLKHFLAEWAKLTSDKSILDCAAHYHIILLPTYVRSSITFLIRSYFGRLNSAYLTPRLRNS